MFKRYLARRRFLTHIGKMWNFRPPKWWEVNELYRARMLRHMFNEMNRTFKQANRIFDNLPLGVPKHD